MGELGDLSGQLARGVPVEAASLGVGRVAPDPGELEINRRYGPPETFTLRPLDNVESDRPFSAKGD